MESITALLAFRTEDGDIEFVTKKFETPLDNYAQGYWNASVAAAAFAEAHMADSGCWQYAIVALDEDLCWESHMNAYREG